MNTFIVLIAFLLMLPGYANAGEYDDIFVGTKSKEKRPTAAKTSLDNLNYLKGFKRFEFDERVKIYEAIDKQIRAIWDSKYSNDTHSSTSSTFKRIGLPRFVLMDRNADGKPDQFSYLPKNSGRKESQDFGFMYDLNRDGKADYLLYYQGTMFTITSGKLKIVWTFYHLIDSNYDGRIDIWVYPDVDRNGDKKSDLDVYAWLYDSNHNGKLDRGEYAGKGITEPIKVSGGRFQLQTVTNPKVKYNDTEILKFANSMLADINETIRKKQ